MPSRAMSFPSRKVWRTSGMNQSGNGISDTLSTRGRRSSEIWRTTTRHELAKDRQQRFIDEELGGAGNDEYVEKGLCHISTLWLMSDLSLTTLMSRSRMGSPRLPDWLGFSSESCSISKRWLRICRAGSLHEVQESWNILQQLHGSSLHVVAKDKRSWSWKILRPICQSRGLPR